MNLLGAREDFSYPSFADYTRAIEAAQPAVNVAALVGHTALRNNHMDRLDRSATRDEVLAMREQLREALAHGAIGLSTGLAYGSAIEADTEEVKLLAEALDEFGALYTTHLRSEFAAILEAMQEAFDIALHARVPVVVSHLKCAGAGNWGRTKEVLFKLENAGKMQRVGCDCYPYSASSSTLDLKQVTDEFDIIINWSAPHPDQAGRKLAEIAADWNVTLLEAARRLQPAGAVYHNMHEDDVRRVLSHPLTMVGSDGLPNDPKPHPRLWGAFPRVLGHYSRDAGLFPLNQAVHKMTGLSAARYGLAGRGLIREGYHADVVLFNPDTVIDRATFADPVQAAAGIEAVWVNGALSYLHGQPTGERAGRWLPRNGDLRASFAAASSPLSKQGAHHEQFLHHRQQRHHPLRRGRRHRPGRLAHALRPRRGSRRLAVRVGPGPHGKRRSHRGRHRGPVAQGHPAGAGHPEGSRLRPRARGPLRRVAGRRARLSVVQQGVQGVLRRKPAGARLRAVAADGGRQGRDRLRGV